MMYFSFSKQEYNGLMVLIVLIMIAVAVPALYARLWPDRVDEAAEQKALQQLTLVELADHTDFEQRGNMEHKSIKKAILFRFDPNVIGLAEWQQLGLSEKQASSILKYRAKGGKFYTVQDLKKMYTISADCYERLAPFVTIDKQGLAGQQAPGYKGTSSYREEHRHPAYAQKHNLPLVEINTADTVMLDRIKGIGPAFARRIFKYRERLGGFWRKEQLMEVFGLDSAKFEEIKDQVTVDSRLITRININTAEAEELKKSPYLRFNQINAIIQFRKQHGNYGNIADLNKVAILPAEIIAKIAPYISF